MSVKGDNKASGKRVLIYDRLWWIQGQRALLLKQYDPDLEIKSYYDFMSLVKREGSSRVNQTYAIISTLGLWTAERLIRTGIHVHTSVAGSYSHLAINQDHFKEWSEEIKPNYQYFKEVIGKIDRIGAVNQKLKTTIKKYCPNKHVDYMKPFVETNKFKPNPVQKKNKATFIVGWVGNPNKRSKNYHTVYQMIKQHFRHDRHIQFREAIKQTRIERNAMPDFYNSIDLLLVVGVNEGLPNPAMEAYSCGVPVLGTNTGIIKEWASPTAKSLILNSSDPKKFIDKINQLRTNQIKLQTLGQEIRKNIEDHWTVDANIHDWLRTLCDVGSDHS